MSSRWILTKSDFDALLAALHKDGYSVLSPQVSAQEVSWSPVSSASSLRQGYRDEQHAGSYRLHPVAEESWFTLLHAAPSLKQLTYKPRQATVKIIKTEQGLIFEQVAPKAEKTAVIGVRACDVAALQIQERVFLSGEYEDEYFKANRESLFVIAVNCTFAHETCFCASMNCGPGVKSGFDLALTELDDLFLVEAGSEKAQQILDTLQLEPAGDAEEKQAQALISACAASQSREMPQQGLPQSLYTKHHSEQWQQVAERCLSCANCTMVCPTCFCHAIEESPDMARSSSERERVWDSCFNPEHGYIHGKNMRPTTADRYRMWMTHKLAAWIDQFETSGCTGCGRCITWCPAGIDLVAEARAVMTESSVSGEKS